MEVGGAGRDNVKRRHLTTCLKTTRGGLFAGGGQGWPSYSCSSQTLHTALSGHLERMSLEEAALKALASPLQHLLAVQ